MESRLIPVDVLIAHLTPKLDDILEKGEKIRREKLLTADSQAFWLGVYDPERRTFSEMKLCEIVGSDIFSKPFKILPNRLVQTAKIDGSTRKSVHKYAEGPAGFIACIFPGQFVLPEKADTIPGERIDILRQQIPDLIHELGQGVVLLYGRRDDIARRTGILYQEITYPLSPFEPICI